MFIIRLGAFGIAQQSVIYLFEFKSLTNSLTITKEIIIPNRF